MHSGSGQQVTEALRSISDFGWGITPRFNKEKKMKKLIVIVATAMMACVASASQFKWSFSGTKADTGDFAGCMVYMVIGGISGTIDSVSQITSAADGSAEYTISSKSAGTGPQTYADAGLAIGTYQIYTYVVKGDSYFAMGPQNVTTVGDGTDGNPAGTPTTVTFASQSQMATPSNWTTVPEPTSALLMVLGFAGLALRRKRA